MKREYRIEISIWPKLLAQAQIHQHLSWEHLCHWSIRGVAHCQLCLRQLSSVRQAKSRPLFLLRGRDRCMAMDGYL